MNIENEQINNKCLERPFTTENIDFSRLRLRNPREATKEEVKEELVNLQERLTEL